MPHSAKYSRKVAKYKFLQKFSELSRKIDYDTIIIIDTSFWVFVTLSQRCIMLHA